MFWKTLATLMMAIWVPSNFCFSLCEKRACEISGYAFGAYGRGEGNGAMFTKVKSARSFPYQYLWSRNFGSYLD